MAYLKVNITIFVHVERAEDVIAKLFGVTAREKHLVHVHKFGGRQLPIGTVLLQQTHTQTGSNTFHRRLTLVHIACGGRITRKLFRRKFGWVFLSGRVGLGRAGSGLFGARIECCDAAWRGRVCC